MFILKKIKLEKELINEIKTAAGINYFPDEDAKKISEMLASYNRGPFFAHVDLNILEKYPNLYKNWDSILSKYIKLGIFKNWNSNLIP